MKKLATIFLCLAAIPSLALDVTLNWDAALTQDAITYTVYGSQSPITPDVNNAVSGTAVTVTGISGLTTTITSLAAGTWYFVVVTTDGTYTSDVSATLQVGSGGGTVGAGSLVVVNAYFR